MKYSVLAGNLTAHANFRGAHLDNYLANRRRIAKILSEELILHNHIFIPIPDFFTACGLLVILGEPNFLALLEANQLRFLKYQGQITFLKGIDKPADFGITTPKPPHAWSSPVDVSLEMSLKHLEKTFSLKDKGKLTRLLLRQTDTIDSGAHLEQIKPEVFEIFSHTDISKKPLDDFLKDRRPGQVNGRILGVSPTDYDDPISVFLALMNFRFETNIKSQFECQDVSPTADVKRLIGLDDGKSNRLWEITELYDIPDFGEALLSGDNHCRSFIELSRSDHASDFRNWFHANSELTAKELRREFVGLTDSEP